MFIHDTDNVTGKFRKISAIYEPTSVNEIIKLVKDARLTKIPLYPISTGFNWGYGSKSPVVDNCALVDLSKMNRILNSNEISIDNPIAVIEPGVTQIQLYEFLQKYCRELTFNITGSSNSTSIIGNSLDRGVGYLGPRKEDLFGLEIITGTGEILQTGFRRLSNTSPLAFTHPYGLGPILDGLFFQSNFGIIVSACFRLYPKRPKEIVISIIPKNNNNLPTLIDELSRLKREHLINSVPHIANRARTEATLNMRMVQYLNHECKLSYEIAKNQAELALNKIIKHEWASLAVVKGNNKQVEAALEEIKARIKNFAFLRIFTESRLNIGFTIANHMQSFIPQARIMAAAIYSILPLHRLALGTPTDIPVQNLLWRYDYSSNNVAELDQSSCGLLFISPALPTNGKIVLEVIEGMKMIAAKFNHILYITINIETATSLIAVTNLLFDRTSQAETDNAHRCAATLLEFIRKNGLELYRSRSDVMEQTTSINPEYWKKIAALKQVFDPDNIIAPGRYSFSH